MNEGERVHLGHRVSRTRTRGLSNGAAGRASHIWQRKIQAQSASHSKSRDTERSSEWPDGIGAEGEQEREEIPAFSERGASRRSQSEGVRDVITVWSLLPLSLWLDLLHLSCAPHYCTRKSRTVGSSVGRGLCFFFFCAWPGEDLDVDVARRIHSDLDGRHILPGPCPLLRR